MRRMCTTPCAVECRGAAWRIVYVVEFLELVECMIV